METGRCEMSAVGDGLEINEFSRDKRGEIKVSTSLCLGACR